MITCEEDEQECRENLNLVRFVAEKLKSSVVEKKGKSIKYIVLNVGFANIGTVQRKKLLKIGIKGTVTDLSDLRLDYIYNTFGKDAQIRKLTEETLELAKAAEDFAAGKDTARHVTEELADVIIVASQLMDHGVLSKTDYYRMKAKKIRRTVGRIRSGYYEKGGE